jgi:hypothetical protein
MLAMYKDRKGVVNVENTSWFYIGDRCDIRAEATTGKGCWIAEYSTTEIAQEALTSLLEAAARGDKTFVFPDEEALKRRIQARPVAWHHATGKKTKGHGGS